MFLSGRAFCAPQEMIKAKAGGVIVGAPVVSRCIVAMLMALLAVTSGCSKKEPTNAATGPDELTRLDRNKPKDAWLIDVQKKIFEIWLENAPRGLPGKVVAGVAVRSDGQLVNVRILESSGVVALDEYAVEAIQTAAPFPPFPAAMKLEVKSFRTRFDYRRKVNK